MTIAFLAFAFSPALAEESPFNKTDLPLPRYASLASGEVNVRAGPGLRYPVEWVYKKKNFPVEIIREFEHWREIRDFQGQTGWVHKTLLSGARTVLIVEKPQWLLKKPSDKASPVAKLDIGVVGTLGDCKEGWCEIEVAGYDGWLQTTQFWGGEPSRATEQIKVGN